MVAVFKGMAATRPVTKFIGSWVLTSEISSLSLLALYWGWFMIASTLCMIPPVRRLCAPHNDNGVCGCFGFEAVSSRDDPSGGVNWSSAEMSIRCGAQRSLIGELSRRCGGATHNVGYVRVHSVDQCGRIWLKFSSTQNETILTLYVAGCDIRFGKGHCKAHENTQY